jgi:imidazolonepropionase-like amidohydrolase
LAIRAGRNAQGALAAGVTTVRDCGGRVAVVKALAQAIEEELVPGPRIVYSGAPITTTGGHCHYFGIEAEGVDRLKRAVRELHKAGIHFVKAMATGGNLTPGSNVRAAQYSQAELTALAHDAHRLGYRIAGHAHGTEGIRRAVAAGFDTIEHCTWLAREESRGYEYVPEVVEDMVRRGIYVCRTIAGSQWLRTEEASRDHSYWPAYDAFRRMVQAGVKLIAGSDAGVDRTPTSHFAYTLETMAALGTMAPEAVLASATSLAAEAMGLQHEIGTLEVGKRADLIAVDGDPLADLRVMRRARAVIRNGRIVARDGQLVYSEEGTASHVP